MKQWYALYVLLHSYQGNWHFLSYVPWLKFETVTAVKTKPCYIFYSHFSSWDITPQLNYLVSLWLKHCVVKCWRLEHLLVFLNKVDPSNSSLQSHCYRLGCVNHWVCHGPLARYVKLWVAHAPRMPGTFSPPPRVSDPDMHRGTWVTHVPWCMPGSLTSGFFWSRCREKRSRHSRRMHNPQSCVSGKRPKQLGIKIIPLTRFAG